MLKDAVKGKYPGYLLEGMACPGGCVGGVGTLSAVNRAAAAVAVTKTAFPLELASLISTTILFQSLLERSRRLRLLRSLRFRSLLSRERSLIIKSKTPHSRSVFYEECKSIRQSTRWIVRPVLTGPLSLAEIVNKMLIILDYSDFRFSWMTERCMRKNVFNCFSINKAAR